MEEKVTLDYRSVARPERAGFPAETWQNEKAHVLMLLPWHRESRFSLEGVPARGNYRAIGIDPNEAVPCWRAMTSEAPSKSRRHPRISLPKGMTAAWYGGGIQQVSRVQTLSSGGLSLAASITRPVGSSLMLVFEVPGGVVQAEAVVRSVSPGKEMGLEFTSMRAQARALLDDLLKRLLR